MSSVIELTKDRYSRTRLLACLCLICVKNSSSCYLQDIGIKAKLIHILLELLDESGQVGDSASFAFSSLVAEKEDLQKLAFEANAIDKFNSHLQNCALHPKRLEGIFLALADLCSKLECCRSSFLSLQVCCLCPCFCFMNTCMVIFAAKLRHEVIMKKLHSAIFIVIHYV